MKYYSTIESILSKPAIYSDPFVLQWEIPNPKDGRDRMYVIFDGVKEYMSYMNNGRFTTCHEVLMSPMGSTCSDIHGHPAFDIDIKDKDFIEYNNYIKNDNTVQTCTTPITWESKLEKDIYNILSAQYPGHIGNIEFVWLTSTTTSKISKHLIIKNIVFTSWRVQMKILVQGLKSLYISSDTNKNNISTTTKLDIYNDIQPVSEKVVIDCIDDGIMRKNGSLRLPLNTKKPIEGYTLDTMPKLIFDNPKYTFLDGLIMIHEENKYTVLGSSVLSISELHPSLIVDEVIPINSGFMNNKGYNTNLDTSTQMSMEDANINMAFDRLNKHFSTGLQIENINESFISLKRICPGTCPISGKVHDSDNAYMCTNGDKIYFGCHRGCTIVLDGKSRKTIDITPHTGHMPTDLGNSITAELRKKHIV